MEFHCYCENCEYETVSFVGVRDIIGQIGLDGGYFMSDKVGGSVSQCPYCGEDSLVITD